MCDGSAPVTASRRSWRKLSASGHFVFGALDVMEVWSGDFYLDSFDGEGIGFGECAAIIEVRLKGKILRIFGKRILTNLGDACIIMISVIIPDIEKRII